MATTSIPSIGDVLLLSQLAWRIGYAFTAARPSAPPEFHDIETELKTLTKTLDLLAEALDDDNSILVRADDRIKASVNKSLLNCQQSLEDLNAFVVRYQEIRKPESEVGTRGIQGVKRWKGLLLKSWRSVWWTTDGGDIQSLRNMLHLHVDSTGLLTKALQSRSVPNLAQTVESISLKLDEAHISTTNARTEGKDRPKTDVVKQIGPEADNTTYPNPKEVANPAQDHPSSTDDLTSYDPSSHTRASSPGDSSDGYLVESNTKFSVEVTQKYSSSTTRGRSAPPQQPGTDPELPTQPHNSQADDRESEYISEDSISIADNAPSQSPGPRQYDAPLWSSHVYPTPLLDRTSSQVSSELSLHETPPTSPPPDISSGPEAPLIQSAGPPAMRSNRAMTTVSQQERFKKELFRDTAILCEVPGLGIEYAQRGDDSVTRVVKIPAECQITLLRKRDVRPDGSTKFITSIWAISDDRTIRMQQELADRDDVIPYTVWGSTDKVSLKVYSQLKFYGTPYSMGPIDTVSTNYTNYIFKDEQGANLFQSAIMGKTLLLSVQTNRTLRVHEGITGSFAYQEQMCALENLRIWKDQDSNGVLAMIHYTPQFRDGYMTFYLNSQRDRVRITDVGNRVIKLKGLNISIEKPSSHRRRHSASATSSLPTLQPPIPEQHQHPQRTDSGGDSGSATPGTSVTSKGSKPPKKVTGARLEFTAEKDKRLFLEKFREVQGFFYVD